MKTFLRENILRLLLLGVPILCLIVLWNFNIYKIWYDNTPWKNLGKPPFSINRVVQAGFVNFSLGESAPVVYVFGKDASTYRCCLSPTNTWKKTDYLAYTFPADIREGTNPGGLGIEQKWNIDKENNPDIVESISFGRYDGRSYEYVAYQIRRDGTIREKYID